MSKFKIFIPVANRKMKRNEIVIMDFDDFLTLPSRPILHGRRDDKHGFKSKKYARVRVGSDYVLLHTFLTGFKMTDHKDGNGLNNCRENLRECDHQKNSANSSKVTEQRKGEIKYKGVYFSRGNSGNFCARIKFNQKKIWLGTFKDQESAARAYDKKARELFGEFAKLNFHRSDLEMEVSA